MADGGSPWDVLFLSYTKLNSVKLYVIWRLRREWTLMMSLPSFRVVQFPILVYWRNELAQLDVTEMDSNANSTDSSEQKSSDEEENGVVESLLTTAY